MSQHTPIEQLQNSNEQNKNELVQNILDSYENISENESHHLARRDQHPSARPHVHHKVREVELDSNPTLCHLYRLLYLAQRSRYLLLCIILTDQ